MSETTWTGWHFLPADGRLRYSDGRAPADGEEVTAEGALVLCERGMHASADILDCLRYAPGPILCRVELRGERIDGTDKSVGRTRVILWRIDATDVLRRFAFWCADRAVRVHAVAALRAPNNAVDAVDARHAKLLADLPEIVDETTALVARDATRAAARDATRAAAWAAARAAARDAAWAAARAAARDAARAAAWAAAKDAGWGAGWGTAWSAASAAASAVQRAKLLAMIEEARS